MKKFLLLVVVVITSLSFTFSQDKVIEKSGKQPKWLNGIEKDYVIVVGSGATVQDAQQNALMSIKERIVSSVAENVVAKSELRKEESNVNNVSTFLEKFATQTNSQSGKVPFLQGISLSKVEEFYWEKLQRKDKKVSYGLQTKG